MTSDAPDTMLERVVIGGDLSRLSPADRLMYYRQVCESVGLNPLTRPFDYLTLSGRLVLYAKRDATDQLRAVHGVSITALTGVTTEGLYIVTASARDAKGRTDSATGAVSIEGLRGEQKANAIMRAETKAKRRVTLSLCGLGILDESEVASVPEAAPVRVDMDTGELLASAGEARPAHEGEPNFVGRIEFNTFARPAHEGEPTDDEMRDVLLGRIRGVSDKLALKPPQRLALWEKHCGKATAKTVNLIALQALYDDMTRLAAAP